MNKRYLPSLQVPNSIRACHNHQMLIQSHLDNNPTYGNRSLDKQSIDSCHEKSLSVWHRLYRTHTGSSYRHSHEPDSPKNDLDFRLRTCYDHAKETFASKARTVVQPMTICQKQKSISTFRNPPTNYPFKIVDKNRKVHINEATKGQHIASDHFANGKHGYSRVVAGAIPVD